MLIRASLALVVLYVLAASAWIVDAGRVRDEHAGEMLNVSYDPTRELWRDLNQKFLAHCQEDRGEKLTIRQSHGSSGSQARAVIDGLDADVVTLALWSDIDAIAKKGLSATNWESRLPNRSLPYLSTVIFVVRKDNPRNIRDWPDLLQPNVKIITPNPKISGNGKLSFLAAWGAVRERGGSDADARAFVTQLYRQVPVLDSGARGATTTFAQKKIGDVHLTWENEAHLEVEEAHGELELVYPPLSIRAEPPVAWVDVNVRRKGTLAAAEAYLRYLYTDEAQEIIAKHHYRPSKEEIRLRHVASLPNIKLFPVTSVTSSWEEAQTRFFSEGAVFDQIFTPQGR